MEMRAADKPSIVKAYYREVLILLFFVGLSVVFTYPLILKFRTGVYGGEGDSLYAIWHFWWLKSSHLQGISSDFCSLIASPFGVDFTGSIKFLLWQAVTVPLCLLFGEIPTFNLFIFVSFPLAAATMYGLTYYLTKRRAASVLAAVIFAFSPYHLAHAKAHLTLAQIQWIPLYILCFLMLWERRSYPRAILAGSALALVILTDYYYGFFMIILTVMFLLFKVERYYSSRTRSDFKPVGFLKISSVFVVSVLLFVSPFLIPVLKNVADSPVLYARPAIDLRIYAARPWEYVLPPVDNPILGKHLKSFTLSHLHGSNTIEQALYLGLIPLALTGWAVAYRRRINIENGLSHLQIRQFVVPFFAFLAVASVLISAPAFISLGESKVVFPSYFLYKIAPMFRCYSRFGLLVLLSVSVLAAVGFADLEDLIGSRRRRVYLLSVVTLLLLIEFANFPPSQVVDVGKTPNVYRWLSRLPSNAVIVEFPFVSSNDGIQSEYQFYQRIHQKKMANGALSGSRGDRIRSSVVDVSNSSTYDMLNQLGVDYAVIHRQKYRKEFGQIPKIASGRLILEKDFGDDAVYRVIAAEPSVLIYYKDGFFFADYWADGSTWNWMSDQGTLMLKNRTGKKLRVDVSCEQVVSVGREKDLEVFLNGIRIKTFEQIAAEPIALKLNDVELKPGKNEVTFQTPQGSEPFSNTFETFDSNEVSLGFRSFRVSADK